MIDEEKEVYKVVSVQHGILTSATLTDRNEYSIIYKIGKWTYPKIGKIFCFDNLENADNFLSTSYHRQIWRAEAINTNKREGCIPAHVYQFSSFWDYPEQFIKIHYPSEMFITPEGTLTSEAIKLVEKVK